MTPAILKILLVSICEPTMPMIYCAKCEILGNRWSCFAHGVKGLNVVVGIAVLLKKDRLALNNPNATSSIETKAPNTPSSSVTNLVGSTLTKVSIRLL
jgi:hypothetical protein